MAARLKIEVITVCVDYGDLLDVTLKENLPLVDNYVVVTSPEDKETISVCRKHSVHCVLSTDHKRNGDAFNKYRLLQRALDQIGAQNWILIKDVDIVLPRKFREMVEWADLNPLCIYGADRQNIVGWDEWQRFKQYAGTWNNHSHGCGHWFHPKYPVLSRWVSNMHGYVPIGFFQLLHSSAIIQDGYHQRRFLLEHGNAARCDVQFALQWDRQHRMLLPEVIVLHLESAPSPLGVNWNGRKSPRFGPAPITSAKPKSYTSP